MPVSLFIYFSVTGEKRFSTLSFTGFFIGMLVCAVRFIFFYSHRLVPESFLSNFLFYFIFICLLPMILYGVYVLLTKDSVEFKLKAFFPLMASFGAVYYPYYFLTMSGSLYTGYDLFFRPVIYLAMLAGIELAFVKIYEAFKNKNTLNKVLYIIMAVFYLVFPAIVDTSYIMNILFWLFAIFAVLYIAAPVVIYVLTKLKSPAISE